MQRGVAQFGRALRSGRRGRRFKSCHLDHGKNSLFMVSFYFLLSYIKIKSRRRLSKRLEKFSASGYT